MLKQIIRFRSKPINIGNSIAVVIPKSYFDNGLLYQNKTYEFEITKEVE